MSKGILYATSTIHYSDFDLHIKHSNIYIIAHRGNRFSDAQSSSSDNKSVASHIGDDDDG